MSSPPHQDGDQETFKAECVFVSSPPHLDGDQEAEVFSFLVSLARASVDSVAYFSPQPTQGVG